MTKKMITMLLAAAMLLTAVGCAPADPVDNSSSSSSMTQEEIDALKEENERLQQELEELKGESSSEEEKDSEEEAESGNEDNSDASINEQQPANNSGVSSQANTQAPATNNPTTSNTAPVSSQPTALAANTQKTSTGGNGPLAKYTVNVSDSSTPAIKVVGETLNGKSAYYFYSDSGKLLGNIPMNILTTIIRENDLSYAEADEQKEWFVKQFNIYRGLDGGEYEPSSGGSSSSNEIDIDEFRDEVIRLTNIERENAGLEPFEVHDTAMEFAQIRAEELAEKFSHTRPDGSVMTYSHYNFAENIAKGQKTPQKVVNDWIASSGHKDAIMADYSDYGNYIGVGVYQAEDGTVYWVQEFIGWDANA